MLEMYVENCKKLLKEGGSMLLQSNNRNSYFNRPSVMKMLDSFINTDRPYKDGEQFELKFGNWTHIDTHWGPCYLQKLFESKGFKSEIIYVKQEDISSDHYTEA